MWKTCTKCGKTAALYMFGRDRTGSFSARSQCLDCTRAATIRRMQRIKQKDPVAYLEKAKTFKRKYYESTTLEERRENRKKWKCEAHKKHRSREELSRIANDKKKQEELAKSRNILPNIYSGWERNGGWRHTKVCVELFKEDWAMPHVGNDKQRYRIKYRNIPEFAINERLRRQLAKAIKRDGIGDTIRRAINNDSRSRLVERKLGYSIAELKESLESKFTNNMSWESFSNGEIHIDHIKPQALFDLSDDNEFVECWSIDNLQPLWAHDNLQKGKKYNEIECM